MQLSKCAPLLSSTQRLVLRINTKTRRPRPILPNRDQALLAYLPRQSAIHSIPFAAMTQIERLADHIEAPELDDRSYRVIRLPNKLEALLVHDAETDKASASVNVNVGSFSDAEDMPGMAHAVEHLLFMGTKKVPAGTLRHRY